MNIIIKAVDKIYNWARANSLTPLVYAASCCTAELLSSSIYSSNGFYSGQDITVGNPRHSDLLIVAGAVTCKNAPILLRLYEQMPELKYVIAIGDCACSGGVFKNNSYTVAGGVDKIIPVDVSLAGCPPKPDDIKIATDKLKEKIMSETILKRNTYIDSHSSNFVLSENGICFTDKQRKEKIGN